MNDPAPHLDPDFDLDAYLARIGSRDIERAPTRASLDTLCAAHPAAIAFENIDPLLGRPPSLAVRDIQAKLVGAQRGGYCFEHNALLRQGLLALGFRVTSLAARVVWMAAPDQPLRPRTHMLLQVDGMAGDAAPYLVDAGFGGHVIDRPLRFEPGRVQPSPHSRLRITQSADSFALETRPGARWLPIYRFTLEAQRPADYEPLNWYTATHPRSLFRHNLVIERLTPTQRANLLNDKLTVRARGEPARVHLLETAAEFEHALTEVFGLRPPIAAAELFERVPRGHDGVVAPPH